MTQKVGLVGLGNAGLAIETPILRNYTVIGYDVDAGRRELAAKAGAEIAPIARKVAEECDI
ncbi:MAG: hypothetical protein JWN13_5709, partial [Betaproteobacteria bacterium]|nr:hypothetical protein [Betaproteobacteria bacterium]